MSIERMMGRHPNMHGSVNEALALAVRHMMFCSDICTSCADACVAEDRVAELRQCIRVCLDCADICDMAFKVGTRRTGSNDALVRSTLELCIQSCEICAAECEKHQAMHAHCANCAEMCHECAQDCRKAVKSL